jgi:hypothetical protein
MPKATITTTGYMGKPWEVTGDLESGLILHKMGQSWVITHVATGCRIGTGEPLRKAATAKRARLFNILPDWSADSVEGLAKAAGMDSRAFADACRAAAY